MGKVLSSGHLFCCFSHVLEDFFLKLLVSNNYNFFHSTNLDAFLYEIFFYLINLLPYNSTFLKFYG